MGIPPANKDPKAGGPPLLLAPDPTPDEDPNPPDGEGWDDPPKPLPFGLLP